MSKKYKKLNKLPIVKIRYQASKLTKKPLDSTNKQVKALRALFDDDSMDLREEFIVLMFGNDWIPIGSFRAGIGTKGEVIPDIHLIFQMLFVNGAQRFIVAHNHPLSSQLPSDKDLEFTHTLSLQSNYLGFELLDHIVVNRKKHYSFSDNLFL